MKISVLNKWDVGGGAARAAWRLCSGLDRQGFDLKYFVNIQESEFSYVHQLNFQNEENPEEDRVQYNCIDSNRTSVSNTYFSYSATDLEDHQIDLILDADIVNLHWIEKFISPNTLRKLAASNKPIVWTLHDERPFTGGCHYTNGCQEFIYNGCRNCIQIKEDPQRLAYSVLSEKIRALSNANLTIVTPSRWLGEQAKSSELFRNLRVEVIANSLDTQAFRAMDKGLAKQELGIGQDEFVILFGAQNANETRKGFKELLEATYYFCQELSFDELKKVKVMVFGDGANVKWDFPVSLIGLGTISCDKELSKVYSAADIFVIPSREDNLPNTILEAMACGTPVIGFDIGGVGDLVKRGETGYLVPIISAKGLSIAMHRAFLERERISDMSVICEDFIRQNFTQRIQVEKYHSLFSELL